jgi:hypothetical protein
VISSFDAIEDRARHAAEGLNLMATTIDIPPLPTEADGRRRRTRVTVAAAAALIVLVVAATLALRGGSTEQNGVPAFEPTPLPGGQRVTTAFRPAASYELPTPHQFVLDEPDDTLVDLGNEFPRADGFVEIVPAGPQPDTAAADARMRVLRRQATLVGGDPATRFVVRVLPKPGDDRWFCADTRRTLCVQRMPRQGRVTLYFVQHDDTTVVILGGSSNDLLGAAVGRVVDGAAATWRWTEP